MRPSVSVTISGMVGGDVAHSVSPGCKHKVRVQEISAARERPKYAESSSMSLTHFPIRLEKVGIVSTQRFVE